MADQYGDRLGSDDLEGVFEMSAAEYRTMTSRHPISRTSLADLRRQTIKAQVAQVDTEIEGCENEIRALRARVTLKKDERAKLLKEMEATAVTQHGKGKGNAIHNGIDYASGEFEWSSSLKGRMREVFGIHEYRLCQQGVCNANMDGRDIVCVMPTGGGKSLTYQLPALIQSGCTLVISPLISLITDQVLHLQEARIEAVKLTGSTEKAELKAINQRLTTLAENRIGDRGKEIKLCYVTPEKIAKSKSFLALLQKLAGNGRLARIVIDEAHCVSELGHDFRPDYQKLHILRQLFPRVPIMALSATCPPMVLQDLIKTLRLKSVVYGRNADAQGTVYFSSPLYRKNLHYTVLPKPAKGSDVMQVMAEYILKNHPNDSGIIYCQTKKDAEGVAEELKRLSDGRIKIGVYHADRHDREKESLHKAWRRGAIKIVCATIAFGLGIDKGDVRFVLHHSLSKSLEGYYQESGRAGRDGQDSDCVLYYRPQDATTLSSMVSSEKSGQTKLHAMLGFAHNLDECRKIQFAKYFSHSSQLSMSSWTTAESDALTPCGHCDNCTRPPESVERRDVKVEAWQLLKITSAVEQTGGSLTLNMLAGLARGSGKGTYEATSGVRGREGKGKAKETLELDFDNIAGGPVELTKDEIEHLLVQLLIEKYLQERYHQTAYSTCVYMTLGPLAPRLTRHSKERLKDIDEFKFECLFQKRGTKSKVNGKRTTTGSSKDAVKTVEHESRRNSIRSAPGKRKRRGSSAEDHENAFSVQEEDESFGSASRRQAPQAHSRASQEDNIEDEDITDNWWHTMRGVPLTTKKRRGDIMHTTGVRVIREGVNEVLDLSDL